MEIKREQLKSALEIVKPGLANKELIEQSTSFALMGDRVVTYNDEISISHPVEGCDIVGAVKADEFYQLLNKFKKETLEVEITDSELLIVGGKGRSGLTLQKDIKLPLEEISEVGKWKKLPDGFIDAIQFAMQSCGNDMSQPVLTCVHISKEGIIESSDSYCLSYIQIDSVGFDFLLPANSASHVVKLNPTHITNGNGWVHFKNKENTIISCRIFEDKYPNLEPHLKVTGTELKLPDNLQDIIDRAQIFAKRQHFLDENIEIQIENKKLTIKGTNTSGWYEESANIRYSGEPINFSITPYLLRFILNKTNNCTFGSNKVKFSDSNWQYVAVLRG